MITPKVLIEDFMVTKVFRITTEMTLFNVAEMFLRKQISGAPVVDTMDRVLSVLGEGLTLRLAASEGLNSTIAHCLPKLTPAKKLIVLQKTDSFQDAYRAFVKHNVHRIPIVDSSNVLQGLISRTTIFRIFVEAHYGKSIIKG